MLGKAVLAKVLDEAREKYTDGVIDHIQSDDFKEQLAEKINKKIDIPFVSEEKEQVFFERCVDLVTDIMEGLARK